MATVCNWLELVLQRSVEIDARFRCKFDFADVLKFVH